ncbi:hypothetical protein PanWU01x14_209600, partial [Parasponia andersonii]
MSSRIPSGRHKSARPSTVAEKKIAATGEKYKIEFDELTWKAVGDNSGPWATEMGQVVCQLAPLAIDRWSTVTGRQRKE